MKGFVMSNFKPLNITGWFRPDPPMLSISPLLGNMGIRDQLKGTLGW